MYYDFYHSPIGLLYIQATERGVSGIDLVDDKDLHSSNPNLITNQCIVELKEYFSGKRRIFDVLIDLQKGTVFQKQVWNYLSKVTYGSTTTYQLIANAINNPLSVRAVGMANGKNPIPIILPCHRVIGSDGSLVGYALGIEVKKRLLMIENPEEYGQQATLF